MSNTPQVADARLGSARLLLELAQEIGDGSGALRESATLQLGLAYRLLLVELAPAGVGVDRPFFNATELRATMPSESLIPLRLERLERSGWLEELLCEERALSDASELPPPLVRCHLWHSELAQLLSALRAECAEY